jgi:PIN domain-containing protein
VADDDDISVALVSMTMRLKNPGGVEAAIAAVRQVRGELTNTNGGNSAADRKDRFLRWCNNWATPQLGNHFPDTEGIFTAIEETFRRLALAPPMSEFELNTMLARDWQAWDRRLEHLASELESLRSFTARPGRITVLDTSALMEGVPFTEYDWHALRSDLAAGPIRLVVPILVIEELDGLKRTRDRQQKADAKQVLRAMWALHGTAPTVPAALPHAPDVTIEVYLDGDWHKRRDNNDGEIIDQALSLQELTGQQIILATCDYNQGYRASAPGIATALMPRRDDQEPSAASGSTSSQARLLAGADG